MAEESSPSALHVTMYFLCSVVPKPQINEPTVDDKPDKLDSSR